MELDLRRKRTVILEENNDYLTQLPVDLLHHILSFLPMKDVIRTCVLSKKWRYIWLSVPCLNFPMEMSKTKEIDFIDRCLLLYKGPTIKKLNISLKKRLKADSHQVDWWIYFCLVHNIKDFRLEFAYGFSGTYTLHQHIFACKFLTVLELTNCNINVPKECKLDSLKTLSLEVVDIRGGSFYDLTSSCPLLERVSLIYCNMKAGPGRSITNVALKTLKIHTGFFQTSDEEVNAPHLVTFELYIGSMASAKTLCVFKRMQALENASFFCSELHWDCWPPNEKILLPIIEMLDNVCHVKTLRLDSCFLEIMHLRWSLSIGEKKYHSSFNAQYLEIQTGLTRWEIPGLAHMLRCSPNVETLIINIEKINGKKFTRNSYDKPYSEEGEYWKRLEPTAFGMLEKLKIVRVYNFMKNLNAVKVKGEKPVIGDFIKKLSSDMDLLKFLLKNCAGLETMIITICVDVKPERMKSRLTRVLSKELLAFPAANQVVEICIR